MPRLIRQVQPPLEFIPPKLNLTVVKVLQWLLPLIMRSRTPLRQVEAHNVEVLVDLYRQFQAGKIRLLLAFRHPSVNDPFALATLLTNIVPNVARQQGITLRRPIHAHFMYDRGIPLWAGARMGWLYSRLGGTPIHRGKVDRVGLRSARDLFANGSLPLAAAPEGATNGHTEIVSPLEPGLSQLAFWCAEDLEKANRSETVLIVPIGIQYRYITPPWHAIDQLLTELEKDAGLTVNPSHAAVTGEDGINKDVLYGRLYRLGENLLSVMEAFYSRFYHQDLAITKDYSTPASDPAATPSHAAFATRLNALMDAALKVAEQYFNLQPKGSVIDRCRRLEQAGWDYIYREDLKAIDQVSPLEHGLADRIAEEADLRIWHMRVVESFVAVTGKYVLEKPTVERFAETTLLMWGMVTRIKGGNSFDRPKLGKLKAILTIGQPLSVSDRWDDYKSSRRNAKQAVATLTQDLQTALEQMARSQGNAKG
ncbi:glycerol acyltransferase [Stenomitos frigidus]|uniref:Glycerol acyltransferase n=1 Tax=Stenomitos frigidus ULC18 TaxID=2107698 RepID=A0A2T1DT69_9CYAN|nr:glycerol acyltransferase [Stenomitos frigidus]PSB23584.1 glycerol acyltransferase [Stenomitos frigidus ULC18]